MGSKVWDITSGLEKSATLIVALSSLHEIIIMLKRTKTILIECFKEGFVSNLIRNLLCIAYNGFGYDCGAAIGAKLAEDLTALSLEIRAGKASPGRFTLKPSLVLFKCRKF